jgi:methyl-accepting chemotaxis protein
MAEHEVKTSLRLEDHMSEALHHIGEGFEALDEKVMETGHELVEMFKNAAAVALGFQLEGAVESIKELGHEAFEAAAGMEEQEKAIRGVLAMIDEEGASLEELGGEAHELNESFAELAETTGQAKGDVVAAFDEMAERTGLATKDVEQLTEQMANAGKAVPGGISALSTGFSNLSSGIIRARNPIVQMISATGMLAGTAKQVAAQMTKMSPEQAMQLGIDAVEKMGAKMKGLPLTFNELVTSLKTMREEIFESLGAPILKALGGPLDRLRGYFQDHKEAIEAFASTVGDKVGEWIGEAADKIQEGFEYLQDHAEQIKEAFSKGAHDVKAVVDFILAHKAAIAEAFAAGKILQAAPGVANVGTAAATGAADAIGGLFSKGLSASVTELGEAVAAAFDPVTLAAEAVAAVALAGAVAAVYGAFVDLTDETSEYYGEAQVAMEVIESNLMEAWDALTQGSDSVGADLKGLAEWLGMELLDKVKEVSFVVADLAHAFAFLEHHLVDLLHTVEEAFDIGHEIQGAGMAHDRPGAMRTGVAGGGEPEVGAIKAPPVYNFTGAITIQQDFKDTDPDRLVAVMKEGFGRAARSKVSASTQVPQSSF